MKRVHFCDTLKQPRASKQFRKTSYNGNGFDRETKIMIYIKLLFVLQFFAKFAGGIHGGNFFQLQSGKNGNGVGNQRSLATFHLCSLNNNCTDVAENKETGKLKQITGSGEKEKAFKDDNLMWTKTPGLKGL